MMSSHSRSGCRRRRRRHSSRRRRSPAATATATAVAPRIVVVLLFVSLSFLPSPTDADHWTACPVGLPCASDNDCKSNSYPSQCGTFTCSGSPGVCYLNAWIDASTDPACAATYVQCGGDGDLCSAEPSGGNDRFEGMCNGWLDNECVYKWCPPWPDHCCQTDDDCLNGEDPGKPSLTSCGGTVRCEKNAYSQNRCVLDATEDTGTCGLNYFVDCAPNGYRQDSLCVKSPADRVQALCKSFGTATPRDRRCSYEWCPNKGPAPPTTTTAATTTTTTTAPPQTTTPVPKAPPPPSPTTAPPPPPPPPAPSGCCQSDADCVTLDPPPGGAPLPSSCGTIACDSAGTGKCIFRPSDPSLLDDACKTAYHKDCGRLYKTVYYHYDNWCDKPPALPGNVSSTAVCESFDDSLGNGISYANDKPWCEYRWCPPAQATTTTTMAATTTAMMTTTVAATTTTTAAATTTPVPKNPPPPPTTAPPPPTTMATTTTTAPPTTMATTTTTAPPTTMATTTTTAPPTTMATTTTPVPKNPPPPPTTAPPPPPPPSPPGGCCEYDSDCVLSIPNSGTSLLPSACGSVYCDSTTKACAFNAWDGKGDCGEPYFLTCGGDDDKCVKKPDTGVGASKAMGSCTGWNNNECVYFWCPDDGSSPPTTTAPPPTTTAMMTTTTAAATTTTTPVPKNPPPPPTTAPPPPPPPSPPADCCQYDSDCILTIPNSGTTLLPSACGSISCDPSTKACAYNAWKGDTDQCRAGYFQQCAGDDAVCTKKPDTGVGASKAMGSCTGWNYNECIYYWCPAGPPLTDCAGDIAARLDLSQGLAGQAIIITGSNFGTTPGSIYVSGTPSDLPCTVVSWTDTEIKAYVSDDAAPGYKYVWLIRPCDGAKSVNLSFQVEVPSFVPTQAMTDALDFILTEMRNGEGGVRTNLIDRDASEDVYLYGHHVTSEHMGLLLWACAAMTDVKCYEETYQYIVTKMLDPTYNLVNWGIDKTTGEPFVFSPPTNWHYNNPLDDFRIVKGLVAGYERWGRWEYFDLALDIGEGLLDRCVSDQISPSSYPDGLVGPGFGWDEISPDNAYTEDYLSPVSYADAWTMKWLSGHDDRWDAVLAESVKLMESSQLLPSNGQFLNSYVKSTQQFAGDSEYQGDAQRANKVRTIQSLRTAIHLARTGQSDAAARSAFEFYRDEWYVKEGCIPEYLDQDGTETDLVGITKDGSVRIYALLARLAYYLGEDNFGDTVVQTKIVAAQDTDPASSTFGHLCNGCQHGNDSSAWETLEGLLAMCHSMDASVVGSIY